MVGVGLTFGFLVSFAHLVSIMFVGFRTRAMLVCFCNVFVFLLFDRLFFCTCFCK